MGGIGFLQQVPLPDYQGLGLAATGVRSLERFSDLAAGVERLAPLKPTKRVDIIDECLDLVVVRPDAPAGFEFTGLSVAEFWSALMATSRGGEDVAAWREALLAPSMQALRVAARKRIGVRPTYVFLEQCWLRLPSLYRDAPLVDLPGTLADLAARAWPDRQASRRSRFAVELIQEAGAPGYRLPTRGRRFPAGGAPVDTRWLRWDSQRLQPQAEDPGLGNYFEYQLALPSLEESYLGGHFMARNVFAHFRCTRFTDAEGRSVLLLDEIQSDWLRDLRRQRRGKGASGSMADGSLLSIPECPVEQDWLAIALRAFIDRAQDERCDLIAWVPGTIQAELNPGLPLTVARELYDRQVPQTLARLLTHDLGVGLGGAPLEVGYPTYRRDLHMHHRRGLGWLLVGPDGETPASEPVAEFGRLLRRFRSRATPVVERLPAMEIRVETVMDIPVDDINGLLPPGNEEALWIGEVPAGAEDERRSPAIQMTCEGLLFDAARRLTEEEAGGHGNRWGAFADDVEGFVETWLPLGLEQSSVVNLGVANDSGQEPLIAAGEPRGMGLVYADREEDRDRAGMLGVIAMDIKGPSGEIGNVLVSALPFFAEGLCYRAEVREIALHPCRLEARLELAVAGTLVFPYDLLFYKHRALYRPGESYTFSLAALAYELEPTGGEEIVIDDPEQVRAFRAQDAWVETHGCWTREDETAALEDWEPGSPADMEPIRIDLSRMAMLMPGEDGPADDAFFQGEVKRVIPHVYVLFGVPIWRVDVVVANPEDQVLTLPFYVPEHCLSDGWRPRPGGYVKGSAWVQGYLVAGADAVALH